MTQRRQLPVAIEQYNYCYDLYECDKNICFIPPFYQCGNETGLTVGNWQGGEVLVAICRQTNCWDLFAPVAGSRPDLGWVLGYLVKSQETNWAKLLWSGGKVFCSLQNFFIYLPSCIF